MSPPDILLNAAGIGFTACVLIASFGKISGCHMNPAVSLAMLSTGVLSGFLELFIYFLSQLCGSVIGAIFGMATECSVVISLLAGGMTKLNSEVANPGHGIILETIITFQLILVILLTTDHHQTAPIFIGLSIFVGIILATNVTGGSMNPVRSFGPSLVFQIFTGPGFLHHYIYWVGPLLGSVLAAFSWKLIFGHRRWPIMEKLFGAKSETAQQQSSVKLKAIKTISESVLPREQLNDTYCYSTMSTVSEKQKYDINTVA